MSVTWDGQEGNQRLAGLVQILPDCENDRQMEDVKDLPKRNGYADTERGL